MSISCSHQPVNVRSAHESCSDGGKEGTMPEELGRRTWVIAEGYIPGGSTGPAPEMTSHETACILNATDQQALIEITIYYTDREPVGPYQLRVDARRTTHLRFNELYDPEPVPRDTPYASVIHSSVPIVIQHTRLDSRQPPHALLSTMAWSE
jgi:hypothetical protein